MLQYCGEFVLNDDQQLAAFPARMEPASNVGSSRSPNATSKLVTKSFSALVKRQGRLVQQQEKTATIIEIRSKQVVARAKAARKQADAAEQSAVSLLKVRPK
jgi:hypothetical protein